jgi:hypothetical protein
MLSDPVEEMNRRYKNVFSSAEGKRVLGDILTKGHYGVTLDADNPHQIGEYNLALVIALRAGVLDPLYRELGMVKKGD